jgi:hypothetical protein
MKTNMKKTITTTLAAFIAVLITATAVQAIGTLTPSGTAGHNTQYTTNNIFNKLTDFTDSVTEGAGSITLPGSVEATFNTLSEIYALLEAEEADLVPENIVDGVTIFGVGGTYTGELEWSTAQGSMNWATAESTCAALTEGGATVGDWRLPTIDELLQGIAYDWIIDGPGGSRFADVTSYWSGTEYVAGNDAWFAGWNGGVDNGNLVKAVSFSVLCVR